jgi:glycosyltransferase involved in cell wall biosynthesis
MTTGPAVSICIPAFGRPESLRTAIQSVLAQSFDDFEVLVGDDSGDLESALVGDPRVRYFRNPTRVGMARNWNALLDRTRGRFVGLLMDDDELRPDFLRTVVSCFDEDSTLGVVFTNHYFRADGALRERDCELPEGRYEKFLLDLLRYRPVAVSASLMRREVWEQVRPLPDLLTADVVLHVRAALRGWPFFYVNRPLMVYRVHPGQLSRQEQSFRNDEVRAWDSFSFDDQDCERLRRRYLAEALTSRAAAHLKNDRIREARLDVARARALDSRSFGARGTIIRMLTRIPFLIPAARFLHTHVISATGDARSRS